MTIRRLGKLTYYDGVARYDIMINHIRHKHLFWRFWWAEEYTKGE